MARTTTRHTEASEALKRAQFRLEFIIATLKEYEDLKLAYGEIQGLVSILEDAHEAVAEVR